MKKMVKKKKQEMMGKGKEMWAYLSINVSSSLFSLWVLLMKIKIGFLVLLWLGFMLGSSSSLLGRRRG